MDGGISTEATPLPRQQTLPMLIKANRRVTPRERYCIEAAGVIGKVVARVARRLHADIDREEVAQRVLVTFALKTVDRLAPGRGITGILAKIARNTIADIRRRERPDRFIDIDDVADLIEDPSVSPFDDVVGGERLHTARAVMAVVQRLPVRERAAIRQRVFRDESCREIAKRWRCKPTAASRAFSSGCARVRAQLAATIDVEKRRDEREVRS